MDSKWCSGKDKRKYTIEQKKKNREVSAHSFSFIFLIILFFIGKSDHWVQLANEEHQRIIIISRLFFKLLSHIWNSFLYPETMKEEKALSFFSFPLLYWNHVFLHCNHWVWFILSSSVLIGFGKRKKASSWRVFKNSNFLTSWRCCSVLRERSEFSGYSSAESGD